VEAGEPRKHLPVNVPRALIEQAERLIEKYPVLGYTNRSSFIEEGIRRWLEREQTRALKLEAIYKDDAVAGSLDFTRRPARKKRQP